MNSSVLEAPQTGIAAWYCARTKPKHEHIAAANLRRHLGLEVFNPRLRMDRARRGGMMRVTESLFPCYVFVKCVLEDKADEIRYVNGVSSLVNFGRQIPAVPSSVVADLVENFSEEEPLDVKDGLRAGDEVVVGCGAFAGMRASVVRLMPARQRVEVLLEMLGRPTVVEVDRWSVVAERESIAEMAPFLTAPGAAWMRA